MKTDASNEPLDTGGFPFPIVEGPEESPYLTWVRNHSNYMAVRGLLDYLRAIGVLVRGIVINFLIFLPYLLGIAIVVAISRFLGKPPPFALTKILLILFGMWILIFPVATPLRRIARFHLTRMTGSDSSVTLRDRYERSFGTFLLAILAVAAFESLPGLLDVFHGELQWPTLASALAVATGVFTVFPKLLSVIGKGVARKVAMLFVGAIGVFVPLLVVLFTADFLVFGRPGDLTLWTRLAGVPFPAMIIVAVVMGWVLGVFKRADLLGITILLVVSVGLLWLVFRADVFVHGRFIQRSDSLQDAAIAELQTDPTRIERLASHEAERPDPQLLKVNGYLREGALEPRPASDDELPLRELAEVGEGAGLYPEFGVFVRALSATLTACEAEAVTTDECSALQQETQRLRSTAAIVRDARQTQSIQQLTTLLLSIPQERLDVFPSAERLDLYANLLQSLASEEEILSFVEVQDALSRWGGWFQLARREIAVTASLSPVDPVFYSSDSAQRVRENAFWPNVFFVSLLALQLGFFCFLTVDVNLTSIHGLYRDRLASAFLIKKNREGRIVIEKDIDLNEVCCYEEGSTAPYHLINTALNLQGSKDIGVRDRKSDFFIFSKRFIGGNRTGFCRSETMEKVFPQMDLATAMAISAAAAAPNMGRGTSPALVAVMTLLNIRLGFWVPNPNAIERWLAKLREKSVSKSAKTHVYTFDDVLGVEFTEIQSRWANLPGGAPDRQLAADNAGAPRLLPTIDHRLVGLSFSGGGIRSATLNLGIAQALHRAGVFTHVDYLSTVSGGGYLGSALTALMRRPAGAPSETGHHKGARLAVADDEHDSVGQLFHWRVRPGALVREILGKLDETSRWVNVSDGGHIENMGAIELLRRRCRYIIVGDGEADPTHHFPGLATLIRTARIDLGVQININVDALRLNPDGRCRQHWAIGEVHYPHEGKPGYLLYLKSSLTGDEDAVIQQYRSDHPTFPHESTADQFFAEGQFEAYRSLGQHIGDNVLRSPSTGKGEVEKSTGPIRWPTMSFADLEQWFQHLWENAKAD